MFQNFFFTGGWISQVVSKKKTKFAYWGVDQPVLLPKIEVFAFGGVKISGGASGEGAAASIKIFSSEF